MTLTNVAIRSATVYPLSNTTGRYTVNFHFRFENGWDLDADNELRPHELNKLFETGVQLHVVRDAYTTWVNGTSPERRSLIEKQTQPVNSDGIYIVN